MARRTAAELAWIGCALSVCPLARRQGRLRLDKNTTDHGLLDALEERISGSTSSGGNHGVDGPAPRRGEPLERRRWYYGDEEDIVALVRDSWDWLTSTQQDKAKILKLAPPGKRRHSAQR